MADPRNPHPNPRWRADIITLLPQAFPGVLGHSLTGRALERGLWTLHTHDLRQYGDGKHKNVDDTPAGGGAGMVLRADVLSLALEDAQSQGATGPVLAMSPRGRPLSQSMAQDLAQHAGVTLVCGRFEGYDQRFLDRHNVEEVSIGDFVLSGGEIAAQALIDATIRYIDGVLGNTESVVHESFSEGLLEHPQYTRPIDWDGHRVPDILLSGHHGEIAKWRHAQAERLTEKRRPDLWRRYCDRREEAEQSDVNKNPKA